MTSAENIFIFGTIALLLILVFFVKNIPWKNLGLIPKNLFQGWWQIVLFNISIFILVQLTIYYKLIDLPNWIVDKDPLLPLLVIVLIQELIFRGLLITWLEKRGKQKALCISVIIFVLFHLIAPYSWSVAGLSFAVLTLVGGYFWGWHFLKFRNIYLLTISHFLVNLSFNYFIFQSLLK
jgi:membrane protease YdiL (CAAX protease family)